MKFLLTFLLLVCLAATALTEETKNGIKRSIQHHDEIAGSYGFGGYGASLHGAGFGLHGSSLGLHGAGLGYQRASLGLHGADLSLYGANGLHGTHGFHAAPLRGFHGGHTLAGVGLESGLLGAGAIGGYGLGHHVTHGPAFRVSSHAHLVGIHKDVLVKNKFAVPVAQPYPVPVEKLVPVPVAQPVPVKVDRPYPVHVPKPIPVPVERPVPYPVEKTVPVPHPVPVPVPVVEKVGVPVPQPYPVPFVRSPPPCPPPPPPPCGPVGISDYHTASIALPGAILGGGLEDAPFGHEHW